MSEHPSRDLFPPWHPKPPIDFKGRHHKETLPIGCFVPPFQMGDCGQPRRLMERRVTENITGAEHFPVSNYKVQHTAKEKKYERYEKQKTLFLGNCEATLNTVLDCSTSVANGPVFHHVIECY